METIINQLKYIIFYNYNDSEINYLNLSIFVNNSIINDHNYYYVFIIQESIIDFYLEETINSYDNTLIIKKDNYNNHLNVYYNIFKKFNIFGHNNQLLLDNIDLNFILINSTLTGPFVSNLNYRNWLEIISSDLEQKSNDNFILTSGLDFKNNQDLQIDFDFLAFRKNIFQFLINSNFFSVRLSDNNYQINLSNTILNHNPIIKIKCLKSGLIIDKNNFQLTKKNMINWMSKNPFYSLNSNLIIFNLHTFLGQNMDKDNQEKIVNFFSYQGINDNLVNQLKKIFLKKANYHNSNLEHNLAIIQGSESTQNLKEKIYDLQQQINVLNNILTNEISQLENSNINLPLRNPKEIKFQKEIKLLKNSNKNDLHLVISKQKYLELLQSI